MKKKRGNNLSSKPGLVGRHPCVRACMHARRAFSLEAPRPHTQRTHTSESQTQTTHNFTTHHQQASSNAKQAAAAVPLPFPCADSIPPLISIHPNRIESASFFRLLALGRAVGRGAHLRLQEDHVDGGLVVITRAGLGGHGNLGGAVPVQVAEVGDRPGC